MELMIDTWNVLHQTGILPPESAEIGTSGLYSLIQGSRWMGENVTLVCDGTPSENSVGGPKVQTIFTGAHRTADDEIMDRVANSTSARSILVITSDRKIIRSIKAKGAQHLGSAAFLQTLVDDCSSQGGKKKKKIHRPTGISKAHADEWRKEFGIDEQTIQDLRDTQMPNLQNEPAPKSKKSNPLREKKKRAIKLDEPMLPEVLLEEARRLLNPSD